MDSIFFLDIKTVGRSAHFSDLDKASKFFWLKKKKLSAEDENDFSLAEQSFWQEAALSVEFNKMIVMSIGYFKFENKVLTFRIKTINYKDEKSLILAFNKIYENLEKRSKPWHLIAYNAYNFHYPLLYKKYLLYDIKLPPSLSLLHRKPWQLSHKDFIEYWQTWDKNYTSLKLLAHTFGFLPSGNILDNKHIHQIYYQEESVDKILQISQQDLILLAKLYLKIQQLPYQLGEEQIIIL